MHGFVCCALPAHLFARPLRACAFPPATQDVYYAHCRTPIALPDGSTRRGLVAIAVGRQSERMRLELEHLQWVRDTLAGDARAAGRITLPLDMWEMDGPPIVLPAAGASSSSLSARADEGTAGAATGGVAATPAAVGKARGGEVGPRAPSPTRLVYVVFPAGLSLLKLMQRGVTARWSERHFASLAYEMLLPLSALCEHGAAHRDVKPENTLLLPPLDAPARGRGGRRRASVPLLRAPAPATASALVPLASAASGAAPLPSRLRLLLADWSTLRVQEKEEYDCADPSDRPLLGTAGYQHFSFFTSAYLGPPWHPKQW